MSLEEICASQDEQTRTPPPCTVISAARQKTKREESEPTCIGKKGQRKTNNRSPEVYYHRPIMQSFPLPPDCLPQAVPGSAPRQTKSDQIRPPTSPPSLSGLSLNEKGCQIHIALNNAGANLPSTSTTLCKLHQARNPSTKFAGSDGRRRRQGL